MPTTTIEVHCTLTDTARAFLEDARAAMQPAEELGGPEDACYFVLMAAIAVDAHTRLVRFNAGRAVPSPMLHDPEVDALFWTVDAVLERACKHDLDDPDFNGDDLVALLNAVACEAGRRLAAATH